MVRECTILAEKRDDPQSLDSDDGGPPSVIVLHDETFYVALRSPAYSRGVVGVLQRIEREGGGVSPAVQLGSFDQVEGGAWRVSVGPQKRRLGLFATSLDAITVLWTKRECLSALVG